MKDTNLSKRKKATDSVINNNDGVSPLKKVKNLKTLRKTERKTTKEIKD